MPSGRFVPLNAYLTVSLAGVSLNAGRTWKMTSNRHVNETENRTLMTPRQRPEDAKDVVVGRVFLSTFPTLNETASR